MGERWRREGSTKELRLSFISHFSQWHLSYFFLPWANSSERNEWDQDLKSKSFKFSFFAMFKMRCYIHEWRWWSKMAMLLKVDRGATWNRRREVRSEFPIELRILQRKKDAMTVAEVLNSRGDELLSFVWCRKKIFFFIFSTFYERLTLEPFFSSSFYRNDKDNLNDPFSYFSSSSCAASFFLSFAFLATVRSIRVTVIHRENEIKISTLDEPMLMTTTTTVKQWMSVKIS